jgi:hypothetical protein
MVLFVLAVGLVLHNGLDGLLPGGRAHDTCRMNIVVRGVVIVCRFLVLECDSTAPSLSSQASAHQVCVPQLTRVPTPRQRRTVRTCRVRVYKTHHIATTSCNDVRGRLCLVVMC